MTLPDSYNILLTSKITQGEYSIVPLRWEDRMLIMNWRNEQIYHLRQAKPLTANDQDNYFKNVVSKLFESKQPSQLLFSYLKSGTCIGYGGLVHINWIDRNAELSFIMDTALEEKEFSLHWKNFIALIQQVAFKELALHKIFTYAFDLRPHLYSALEENGFVREAVLPEHCFFGGRYIDVIIHGLKWPRLEFRKMQEHDVDRVFEWANDSETRKHSFNPEPIEYEVHKKWFAGKIKSAGYYFVLLVDGEEAGLIRFDNTNEGWVIGILISSKFRGQGYAGSFLKITTEEFFNHTNENVLALIKNDNPASIRSFERAGYLAGGNTTVNGINALKYIYYGR